MPLFTDMNKWEKSSLWKKSMVIYWSFDVYSFLFLNANAKEPGEMVRKGQCRK